jgi:A/G-specific adenine glycosylase
MPRRPTATPDPSVSVTPAEAAALSADLRAWYHAHRRVLPWREQPAPWRVWVSEVMLQQTQVDTVLPYFEAFLARFPAPSALAAASLDEVQALWSGLGYYRRARLLQAGAASVASLPGGEVPSDVESLRAIPGIGPYTAGAIASIAFGAAVPLVDGNVERVLSRLVALPVESDGPAGKRLLWELAAALVSPDDPSSHNQGLMELGALVCAPARPSCERCPWAGRCRARASGDPTAFPRKRPRRAPTPVHAVALAIAPHAGSDQLLFARRPADGLLGGLWGLPETPFLSTDTPARSHLERLLAELEEGLGVPLATGPILGEVVHVFTHRTLTLSVVTASPLRPPEGLRACGTDLAWGPRVPAPDGSLPFSTLARKTLALVHRSRLSERQTTPEARPGGSATGKLTKRRTKGARQLPLDLGAPTPLPVTPKVDLEP